MNKLLVYTYLIIFTVIALSLVVFTSTYFWQTDRISIINSTYLDGCEKENYSDITNEMKKNCDGLDTCTLVTNTIKSTPECTPKIKVEWKCQGNDRIQVSYHKTVQVESAVEVKDMLIHCPGRFFIPNNSMQ
ncbi:hypothetical protein HYV31_01985 [candidate division WWE3 bacterium]|nr:hypothetical protein [candidate division WWE3 bacterium]